MNAVMMLWLAGAAYNATVLAVLSNPLLWGSGSKRGAK